MSNLTVSLMQVALAVESKKDTEKENKAGPNSLNPTLHLFPLKAPAP